MADPVNHEQLWEHAKDLGDEMVDAGADPDKTAEAVADFLDKLVPLDVLVPGLPGMALEAVDGAAFKTVIDVLVNLFRGDPDKRAERRAKRQARKAARKAARRS